MDSSVGNIKIHVDALAVAIQARKPIMLWGPPGGAKTSTIVSLVREIGDPIEVVIAALRDPTDFAGLPIVVDGQVVLAPPSWAKRLHAAGRGVAFLDELSCAPPATQAALLRVILEKVVGDLRLPDSVTFVAAANPVDSAAGGWELAPALANRLCHLHWPFDRDKWSDWLMGGGGYVNGFPKVPEGWEFQIPASRALLAAWAKVKPHTLYGKPGSEGESFATPRSWTTGMDLIAACNASNAHNDCSMLLLSGCVGPGAAAEFLLWRRELNLPAPEDILSKPDKWHIPKRQDILHASLAGMAAFILSHIPDLDMYMAGWKVLGRVTDAGHPDIAAFSVRTMLEAYRKWPVPKPELPLKELRKFSGLIEAVKEAEK